MKRTHIVHGLVSKCLCGIRHNASITKDMKVVKQHDTMKGDGVCPTCQTIRQQLYQEGKTRFFRSIDI